MNLSNRLGLGLTYDDVLLVPKLGIVSSRTEVNTDTFLTESIKMTVPVVAAPMSSVTNAKVARSISMMGGSAFIHRNQTVMSQVNEWIDSRANNPNSGNVGCAVGITEMVGDRFIHLYKYGCRLFCLDIAHAHSVYAEKWLSSIPGYIMDESEFIFGSIATGEAVDWYKQRFNPAGFRVGIGPGAACTTREKTGHGVPQLTAVSECVHAADGIPIIADGGINTSGDIVKALAVGASSVMLGRLLAGAEESPHPGHYYGMASDRAKKELDYTSEFTEGVEAEIPVHGTIKSIVNSLMSGIKSGISYSGGKDIIDLQRNYEFIKVSPATEKESNVRV